VVEVKQQSVSSPLAYPDLELFLYAPCEEDVQSSVFASVYFGNASGTDENQGPVSQLVLSPNPATDALYLDFDMQEPAPVQLQLMDMQGIAIKSESLGTLPAGQQRHALNLDALPSGMYLLGLQSNGSRIFCKVVVQR
jgi:hypothetical protein